MQLYKLLIIVLVLLSPVFVAAQWTIELTKEASFLVRYDGATVLRTRYIAWGPNWKAASVDTAIGTNQGERWTFKGDIKGLNIDLHGEISRRDAETTFRYVMDASKASQGNIGGGIQFDLRLDRQVFGDNVPKPQITDDGWSWTPKPGQTVRISFAGMNKKAAFEKGQADEIRAMFIPSDIDTATRDVTMTVALPAGADRTDGVSKRYAQHNAETWNARTVDWAASPVDLSYLNHKPAGIKGFVKADGDRFVYADGTEARFWGANVQAYALFNATNEAIELQAKRIAAMGFNLVRIHHHDSAEWSPNVFVKDADNTKTLDDKQLDRIDYWVKCLKDQGVYVWMDLHVGRPFRAGDQIEAFDELKAGKTGSQGKGFNYLNASITQRMKEFAKDYLTRTNRYTNTRYVDEPALMGILITNENDITHHFGNEFLPDKKHPIHQKWFETIRDRIIGERSLDKATAWKTWEAGASKVVLNQIEYDWNIDFIKYLRSMGVKVPIATTNSWGSDPLLSLPALTAGDVIDVHAYGQGESLSSNPKYDDMSSHWIAAAQVAGMPLVITEWNTEYPQRDRFTQPLFIAANAAFQGWDAPMIYGYQQAPLVPQSKIETWGISADPAMIPLMPAAAMLYRRGDVQRAQRTVIFAPGESLLMKAISPDNSPALRTIAERHRLVIGLPKTPLLPWMKGVDRGDAGNPDTIADGVGETSVTSDTNELSRDWKKGIYTIDTPKTQAAMGWIGDQEIKLKDIIIKIRTPKATVVVTSLDDKPIATSSKLLLTVTAQATTGGKPAATRAEPVVGEVLLKGSFMVETLAPNGAPAKGKLTSGAIELSGQATHWYMVSRR